MKITWQRLLQQNDWQKKRIYQYEKQRDGLMQMSISQNAVVGALWGSLQVLVAQDVHPCSSHWAERA